MPAGSPSATATRATPCDSPAVSQRSTPRFSQGAGWRTDHAAASDGAARSGAIRRRHPATEWRVTR